MPIWYLYDGGWLSDAMFSGWVYFMGAANLLLGNFAFTYANMVAVARRNMWDLVAWAALSPSRTLRAYSPRCSANSAARRSNPFARSLE